MLLMLSIFVVVLILALEAWFSNVEELIIFIPTVATLVFEQLLKMGITFNDTWKKIITFILAIGFSLLAGLVFGWGIFAELVWWKLVVIGIISGVVATGLFSYETVQFVLILLGIGNQKDSANKSGSVISRFYVVRKEADKIAKKSY